MPEGQFTKWDRLIIALCVLALIGVGVWQAWPKHPKERPEMPAPSFTVTVKEEDVIRYDGGVPVVPASGFHVILDDFDPGTTFSPPDDVHCVVEDNMGQGNGSSNQITGVSPLAPVEVLLSNDIVRGTTNVICQWWRDLSLTGDGSGAGMVATASVTVILEDQTVEITWGGTEATRRFSRLGRYQGAGRIGTSGTWNGEVSWDCTYDGTNHLAWVDGHWTYGNWWPNGYWFPSQLRYHFYLDGELIAEGWMPAYDGDGDKDLPVFQIPQVANTGVHTVKITVTRDGTIVGEDESTYTAFMPDIAFLDPDAATVVSQQFPVTVRVTDWYSAGVIHFPALGEYGYGMAGTEDVPSIPDEATTADLEANLDLFQMQQGSGEGQTSYTMPAGAFTQFACLRPEYTDPGSFSSDEPVDALALELELDKDFTIVRPNAGEVILPSPGSGDPATYIFDFELQIIEGWQLNDYITMYVQQGGAWVPVAGVTLAAEVYGGGAILNYTGTLSFWHTGGSCTIRAVWGNLTRTVTVTLYVNDDDDDGGGGGGGGGGGDVTTPYFDIVTPASGAQTLRELTVTFAYNNLSAGPATLRKTLVQQGGSYSRVWDEETVNLGTGYNTYSEPLTIPEEAPDGSYLFTAQLIQGAIALADVHVWIVQTTIEEHDGPTVAFAEPEDGDTVTNDVPVIVGATGVDNTPIFSVKLYIDGMQYGNTLYAPNSAGNYRWDWTPSHYYNGPHILRAVAVDVDGEDGEASISVTLANRMADMVGVFYTKQIGTDENGDPINTQSNFCDHIEAGRVQGCFRLPLEADLPPSEAQRHNAEFFYHVPGDTLDLSQYSPFLPGVSQVPLVRGTTIRWAVRLSPRRVLAYWDFASADLRRLALDSNGDLLILLNTPNVLMRFTVATGALTTIREWTTGDAPTDMAVFNGKIMVCRGTQVLFVDEGTGDLDYTAIVPFDAEFTDLPLITATEDKAYFIGHTAGGSARLYSWDANGNLIFIGSHGHRITCLRAIGTAVYAGCEEGEVLQLGTNGWAMIHAGPANQDVCALAENSGVLYAGFVDGTVLQKIGSIWSVTTTVSFAPWGIAPFAGLTTVGGTGAGGQYIWMEEEAGWCQSFSLPIVGVRDMLDETDEAGWEALFIGTQIAEGTRLYRIEKSADTGYVVGVDPVDLDLKIVKGV